jgi:hypothetical protein
MIPKNVKRFSDKIMRNKKRMIPRAYILTRFIAPLILRRPRRGRLEG